MLMIILTCFNNKVEKLVIYKTNSKSKKCLIIWLFYLKLNIFHQHSIIVKKKIQKSLSYIKSPFVLQAYISDLGLYLRFNSILLLIFILLIIIFLI